MGDSCVNHADRPVVLTLCPDYSEENVTRALRDALTPLGGLSWITPGMTVGIKANLVSAMKPDEAATTHPALLCALTKMLKAQGAGRVIIGDSPGNLFTAAVLNHVYDMTGLRECEAAGAELNLNFETVDTSFPEAAVLKFFTYTAWLDECDALIDFCKLKSHGMMGMSAAAKNLFGVIPGTMKPEYHIRFPQMSDFAAMLIDINDYFAPKLRLCLTDGVLGMEGNGPTKGTPRQIGVLLASASPHASDMVAARLIGLAPDQIPTLISAIARGRVPASPDDVPLMIVGTEKNLDDLSLTDFESVAVRQSHQFTAYGKLTSKVIRRVLSSRPQLKASECIGCGKCASICPAHAIRITQNQHGRRVAVIDRSLCIRCFCCQEFCPKGAMKVHRTLIAKMLVK